MKNISIRQAPNDNRTYINQNNITSQMNEVLEINEYILKKGNISFMIIILKTRMNVIIKSISYELKLTTNEFSMTANQLFKTIDELYLYIKNIFEKKNVIIQDINNRVMKLILGAYDIMKGGMKQIEIYLYSQNNINDFIFNDLFLKYIKLEENINILNEKNKLLIDENMKIKEDNLKFKSDILKLKSDMNLLQIQNSRYENHINLLLSGIDKITTFIDESSIKADEVDNSNIKKSVSLTKSNSVSQNLNLRSQNNLKNMYQSFDNYSLKQNQSLSQFNVNSNINEQDQEQDNNESEQNLSKFNEEQLYRTEENRVIFRNGILYGIIKKYSEIEKVVAKIQTILQKGAKFTIIYKASELGDRAMTFHQKCDDIDISLILIETEKGVRFGGFTTKSWNGNCVQKIDNDAFVFSIDKNKIYEVIKNEMAIGCYPKFGPVFFGCQIRVYDNFFTKGGSTYLKGLNYATEEDYELTNGNQIYGIKELEVYEVKEVKQ